MHLPSDDVHSRDDYFVRCACDFSYVIMLQSHTPSFLVIDPFLKNKDNYLLNYTVCIVERK